MSRKRILKSLPLVGAKGFQLEVVLKYDIGGHNYFTSENVERGYKLSVTPTQINKSDCGTYQSRVTTAFSGISAHLETKTRFTQSHFDKYEVKEEDIDKLVNYVLTKERLELEKEKEN